jgi:hypothetical protein
MDVNCGATYRCIHHRSDGELLRDQLGLSPGASRRHPNTQSDRSTTYSSHLYWACSGATIQDACQSAGPVSGFERGASFGNGFQGTDVSGRFVMSPPSDGKIRTSSTGPVISEAANAEGESPMIAPNTWVEIMA